MQSSTRAEVQDTLQIVMDWGDNAYDIKNNAVRCYIAHNFIAYISQAQAPIPSSPTSSPTTHGSRGGDRETPSTKLHGVMFGIGWHLSQEPGKSLVNYAPRNKDEEALATYVIRFYSIFRYLLISLPTMPAMRLSTTSYPGSLLCIDMV
jgi:hypothetical protein